MSKNTSIDDTADIRLLPVEGSASDLATALEAEGLPVDDLTDEGRSFFRIDQGGSTVGFCGYEAVGSYVLLRSIVVLPSMKGRGIGESATRQLMDKARQGGAQQAYLLTTSAAPFFERLGFAPVARVSVPEAILKTRQATSLCPASATILTKQLQA